MTSNSRSELFSKAEIYELQTWANGYLKALDTYLGTKNFVEDDWVEYTFLSGETVDVLISMDRDEGSPTFEHMRHGLVEPRQTVTVNGSQTPWIVFG